MRLLSYLNSIGVMGFFDPSIRPFWPQTMELGIANFSDLHCEKTTIVAKAAHSPVPFHCHPHLLCILDCNQTQLMPHSPGIKDIL